MDKEAAFKPSSFTSARDMIPMEQVQEQQAALKCGNATKRGCRFNKLHAMLPWCTCCLMLKAIGTDFDMLEKRLVKEDPNFALDMTSWQMNEYIQLRKYWTRWCANYPKGATS